MTRLAALLLAATLPCLSMPGIATATDAAPAATAAPSFAYDLPKKPSVVLTDRAALQSLAELVWRDASQALAAHRDSHPAVQQAYRDAAIDAAMVLGRYDDAIALQVARAATARTNGERLLAGWTARGLKAAAAAGDDPAARRAALRTELAGLLAPLPVAEVAGLLKARKAQLDAFDGDAIVELFATSNDPVHAKGTKLDLDIARDLLAAGFVIGYYADYGETVVGVIDAYLAAAR